MGAAAEFHAVFMARRVRCFPLHATPPWRTPRRGARSRGAHREYASVPNMDKWLVGIVFGAMVTYEAVSLIIGIAPHELFALWRRHRSIHAVKHQGGIR